MDKHAKIYIAGHTGMVGGALLRGLQKCDYTRFVLRSHRELDLTRQAEVESFFAAERPDYVFLCAAKVGGIVANNTYKADFIRDNLAIGLNVVTSAAQCGVKKLLNLGSSCIYPKLAPQPLREEHLLTGALEATNEPYAIAKIAILKLCRYYNEQYGTAFISLMPTNLYGIGDNFDLVSSHVLPAMIRKFHEGKVNSGKPNAAPVTLWGSGNVRREFLNADDLASAAIFLMKTQNAATLGEIINVGVGEDLTIRELAELVQQIVGYEGEIVWDTSKPDGTPQKLLDISRIKKLGWSPRIPLEEGIRAAYQWFCQNGVLQKST